MKYMESGSLDPYYNLAFEEYVLTHFKEDDYALLWQNQNTVVVGKFQNTIEEINPAGVKAHNVSVVRRNTGGGAVYHDLGNLNFSFITDWEQSPGQGYEFFLKPVIEGLQLLGISAQVSGRNDLTVDGYKISGNAQTIIGGRILHHGTLLVHSDLAMMAKILTPNSAKIESKGLKSVKSRVANLSRILEREVDTAIVREALKTAFFNQEKAEIRILTAEEEKEIAYLAESKYRTYDWNYAASPLFNFTKSAYFQGGQLSIQLFVEEGKIKSCKIYGDFLAVGDIKEVEEKLKGINYREEDVAEGLRQFPIEIYFGTIRFNEVLSCFF